MKAKFYLGPRDGAEEEIQTFKGFAPELYQMPVSNVEKVVPQLGGYINNDPLKEPKKVIAYYDLQEIKEGVAYYKYRCTA